MLQAEVVRQMEKLGYRALLMGRGPVTGAVLNVLMNELRSKVSDKDPQLRQLVADVDAAWRAERVPGYNGGEVVAVQQ